MPNVIAYRERLWPAPWVFIATGLVIPASLLVFLPIAPLVGVGVAVLLYAAIVGVLLATTATIEVTDAEFRAGRARMPLSVVGSAQAFEGDEASAERGVRLDARAWLLLRGWIPGVVRVEVVDDADPTPYWLVASRNPEKLAAALKG
jgi:Protein of unknown function (DUF3093)